MHTANTLFSNLYPTAGIERQGCGADGLPRPSNRFDGLMMPIAGAKAVLQDIWQPPGGEIIAAEGVSFTTLHVPG
jgi:hypothetical protein